MISVERGKVSVSSKVYLLGGRFREPDESAGLASASCLSLWQVLWRDVRSSSTTHFILGIDAVKLHPGVALVAVDS